MRLNRSAMSGSRSRRSRAWTQTTASPPTHGATAATCRATPVVATEWLAAEAECPVSGAGSSAIPAMASRPNAAAGVVVVRASSATTTASSTTIMRAVPCGSEPT
ncbi:hypothetical protein LUW74_02680 [Actinomadura madurae]|uniref:hypothetical protein n=1 Tax=Actinomadura madurae TaxID=1993 RepID=UPI002026261E|nr:hypothetical protein [Actinomadura madurae]URN10904.1 hypothetical protein LUW74_02680 [Actinomadura madurae]